jgi:hypothetical protein
MTIDSGAVAGAAGGAALDCLRGIAKLYQFDRFGRGLRRLDATRVHIMSGGKQGLNRLDCVTEGSD